MTTSGIRIRPVGDTAVLVDAPALDAEAAWRWVQALDRALEGVEGIDEVSPALVNLLVRFDPLHTDHDAVARAVRRAEPTSVVESPGTTHELTVRYGGDAGPDLVAVATQTSHHIITTSNCS